MPLLVLLIILLVVGIPCYLYYDNTKETPNDQSVIKFKVFMTSILYSFIGLILTLTFFLIFSDILPFRNLDPVVIVIIILCSIIMGCTAWIVQTIKNMAKKQ